MGFHRLEIEELAESEGDYLWFIDADDLIVTGSINRIKDFIDKSTQKKILFCQILILKIRIYFPKN